MLIYIKATTVDDGLLPQALSFLDTLLIVIHLRIHRKWELRHVDGAALPGRGH
jgi:hypothetical protein